MTTRSPVPVPANPQATALASRDATLPPVVETASAASAAMAKAAVEARYLMALQRPRDWAQARARILEACDRPRFAEEARWKLPRGEKELDGLSIRFAEEVVRWVGNVLVTSQVMFEDSRQRILRVMVCDLEANVTYEHDVVVDKTVERQSATGREVVSSRRNARNQTVYQVLATDDEVLMKQNSLASKALRTGVLRLLPADVQEEALEHIRAAQGKLVGPGLQAEERQTNLDRMVEAYAQAGVPVAALEEYLGHPVAALTPAEFSDLRSAFQAIRDGETTWATVLQAQLQATKRDKPTARGAPYVKQGDLAYSGEEPAPAEPPAVPAPRARKTREQVSREVAEHGYPPEDTAPLPHAPQGGPRKCNHGVFTGTLCVECQQDAEEEAGDARE